MNLSEKILHCRRKSGLSQEALADKFGVSRQALVNGKQEQLVQKSINFFSLQRNSMSVQIGYYQMNRLNRVKESKSL